MTQKQLGEALGISDKTISKWECGNGLPDISIIMPLCSLLEINVNELLSGENLTQEEYPGRAALLHAVPVFQEFLYLLARIYNLINTYIMV